MNGEKLPPHDTDAEEAVIGSLLIDGSATYKVDGFLDKEDFYREQNRWIYEACLSLSQRDEAINQITVAQELSRQGRLEDALSGIQAAHQAGLEPVKINSVIIRGLNDDEVVNLARKSVDDGWHVRFIEWMPVGETVSPDQTWGDSVVTATEIRDKIEAALGALETAKIATGAGPARYYRLPGAKGTIGFITPVSEHFCFSCNRLRLTADGKLRPCVLSEAEVDLRTPLRAGAALEELADLLVSGIMGKPDGHHLDSGQTAQDRVMAEIGG